MANYNPSLVKINRSYTFEELAAVFGIHKNTVACWVKSGLHCLKDQRPYLILGAEAKAYLQQRRASKKQKCKANEMYCVRCKTPTNPAEHSVVYLPLSATKGRLTGLCSRCECLVNKFIAHRNLEKYASLFELSQPTGLEHISDCDNPL